MATFLNGADSITAPDMPKGLDFYCYYGPGAFNNAAQVAKDYPGKKYIGIDQAATKGIDLIDVERGAATPADIPAHLKLNPTAPNLTKPGYYTSASNIQACNEVCAKAGYVRTEYLVMSAHWGWKGGKHLCGPSTCGYPQADITQWASSTAFDSDYTTAGVFKVAPKPTPPKTVQIIVSWFGDDGLVSRKGQIPQELWAQLVPLLKDAT